MIRPLAVLTLLLPALPAAAEPFVILVHESPAEIARRADPGTDGQAYWAAYAAWGAAAADAGLMRGGAAMVPVPVAVSGALPQSGLVLGGFFQIDAPSAAVAADWAARLPAAATGAVEVRAVVPMPAM